MYSIFDWWIKVTMYATPILFCSHITYPLYWFTTIILFNFLALDEVKELSVLQCLFVPGNTSW